MLNVMFNLDVPEKVSMFMLNAPCPGNVPVMSRSTAAYCRPVIDDDMVIDMNAD